MKPQNRQGGCNEFAEEGGRGLEQRHLNQTACASGAVGIQREMCLLLASEGSQPGPGDLGSSPSPVTSSLHDSMTVFSGPPQFPQLKNQDDNTVPANLPVMVVGTIKMCSRDTESLICGQRQSTLHEFIQWSLKCGPETISVLITGELVGNANSWAPAKFETLGCGQLFRRLC